MNYKAAIFDMDGTLIDAACAWRENIKKTFALLNHEMTDEEFVLLYRMTYEETVNYFYEVYEKSNMDSHVSFESIMDEFLTAMEMEYTHHIKAKPFALEFMKSLYEKNIPTCVATLTPKKLAEEVLERLGFLKYIKFIITGDEVGYSKKFPNIFLESAQKLGYPPNETIVFEDSLTAIKTAYKSNFIVCGIYDEFQSFNFKNVYPYSHFAIFKYQDAIRIV